MIKLIPTEVDMMYSQGNQCNWDNTPCQSPSWSSENQLNSWCVKTKSAFCTVVGVKWECATPNVIVWRYVLAFWSRQHCICHGFMSKPSSERGLYNLMYTFFLTLHTSTVYVCVIVILNVFYTQNAFLHTVSRSILSFKFNIKIGSQSLHYYSH